MRGITVIAVGAVATTLAACGGHGSTSSRAYRPKATADCLRAHGYQINRLAESKPTEANRNSTGIVYAVVTKRKVAVLFHPDASGAIADEKFFKASEARILATESKYRAFMKRYMESANYRVGTVFVGWAGVGKFGKPVLLSDRSREALGSCLRR